MVATTIPVVSGSNANLQSLQDSAITRAQTALDSANGNLNKLGDFQIFTGHPVDIALSEVDTTPVELQQFEEPVIPKIEILLPELPESSDFSTPSGIKLSKAPTFTKDAPDLRFPAAPIPLNQSLPTAPSIDVDLDFPDRPTLIIPTVPTLQELDIPDAPILDLPVFTAQVPTQSIVPPGRTFYWSENPYSSSTLSDVQTALLERVSGGTGLSTTVEQQIWDRERNREDRGALRTRTEILSNEAQLGFSRPTGSTVAALDFASQEIQNNIAGLGRDISIKQAELEQANIQQTITSIISLEQILIGQFDNIQNRSLDAEKFSQNIYFDIFNAQVSKFNIELETYKAFVLAFETQLRAEIELLNVYRAELEAKKLIGDLNLQDIQIYTSQLNGLQTQVDLYRSEVEAINVQIGGEALKIESFKAEIDGFSSQVEAKNSEYQGFQVLSQAESVKMQAYAIEVSAFANRITAYSQETSAKDIEVRSDISIESLKLDKFRAELDQFGKNLQAEVSVYQAQSLDFQGRTTLFNSQVQADVSRVNTEFRKIDQNITYSQAQVEIALQNAQINLNNIKASLDQTLDTLKSVADVSASLASSSLAGINTSSSFSHDLNLNSSLSESI